MSHGAVFLHLGHLGSTDAVFFLATLVYMPAGAVLLVAGMDAEASNGLRLAQRFMGHFNGAGAAVKLAAFLMVVSSSIDLGFVPSHVRTEPVASALFGLDAAVLIGSSALVILLPALRPAALILLVAGMFAYALGGVQLDVTALVAKALEGLALALLLVAIIRTAGELEPEEPAPALAAAEGPPAATGKGARRAGRSSRAGRRSRRRPARRTGA